MVLTHEIVQSFITMLEEALPYKVTITDINGYIIGSSDHSRLNKFHPSAYEILCGRQPIETLDLETDSYINLPKDVLLGYGEKILYEGECLGIIGLVGSPEEMKQSIKTAQLMLHLLLDRKRGRDELTLIAQDKNAFLLRLLRGQCGSERWTTERANTYGFSLGMPRCAVMIRTDLNHYRDMRPLELSTIRQNISQTVRAIFSSQEDMIYEYDHGEIIVLTAADGHRERQRRNRITEKAASRLCLELKKQYDVPVVVGIGEEFESYRDYYHSVEQSRKAAEIGARTETNDGVYHYAKMRLGRIVAGFSQEIRPILEKDILNKLQENDDGDLIETLRVYFEMNGSVAETAQKLFLHRNTLQYRFRRIREITGFDIHNIDDLVQLRLAILQYHYFRREGD